MSLQGLLFSLLQTFLYLIPTILILTTIVVVVRTIIFQRPKEKFRKSKGSRLTIIRWRSTWLRRCAARPSRWSDTARRTRRRFAQLHQMLAETYPLVHRN